MIDMAKNKNEEPKGLSEFEHDCIWMSTRYCIGRQTIASQMHADGIANYIYNRMTKDRLMFMAQDINREIYDNLRILGLLDIDYHYNIPTTHFKPLDVLYQGLNELDIRDNDQIRKTKVITALFNKVDNTFSFEPYSRDNGRYCNTRSVNDFKDLEVWQRLANLLNIDSHKWCKLIDGTIVEYYEYWRMYYGEDGKAVYEKIKEPIEQGRAFNFIGCRFIPDESIKEDNVNPNNE